MRFKITSIAICTVAVLMLLLVTPVYSAVGINATQGPVGTDVTISGLTPYQSYAVKWDGTSITSGVASSAGTANFTVPDTNTGSHALTIESPSGITVFSVSFVVTPSITIDLTEGVVGTSVIVKGTGFAASEEQVKVTFDSVAVKSGITATSSGKWETSFLIPPAIAGNHIIDASGYTTSADSITNRTFIVKPNLVVKPTNGGVGTQVSVTGNGFNSAESSILVTYDGTQVRTALVADSTGSWSTTFTIPSSTQGNHIIDASGANTAASSITDVIFSVSPGISVQPNSVYVSDEIKVNGTGFASNESAIQVLLDNVQIKGDITADSSGQWAFSFTMPESVNGSHSLDAAGSTTSLTNVVDAVLVVKAKLVIRPTSGNASEKITISGTGFSKSKEISISYGGKTVPLDVTSDAYGGFSVSFTALEGINGKIAINVEDAQKVTAATSFTMETTAPDAPRVSSPKDGARVGFLGDTRVTFDWTDVSDPSGVYYNLQIANKPDFATVMYDIAKLPTSEYTLTEAESLAPGEYYWRVKAIDKAGNSGTWVGPMVVKTAYMDMQKFALIVACIIIFIIIISTVPRAIARAVRKKPQRNFD
jgi:hypothetical protein